VPVNFLIDELPVQILIHLGLHEFTELTIGTDNAPLGCAPVYIDGSVVPIPLIAAVIQQILDGRTGARLFVRCLKCYSSDGQTDLPVFQDFNIANQPYEHGSISHQDGEFEDYPMTIYFDNRAYLGPFFAPTDGNANGHLHFRVYRHGGGGDNTFSATLVRSDFGRNSTSMGLGVIPSEGDTGDVIFNQDFNVICNEQYYLQIDMSQGALNHWGVKFISASWDDVSPDVPPPPPPDEHNLPYSVNFDTSYPDKAGWQGTWRET
jgi:hypothetical protein